MSEISDAINDARRGVSNIRNIINQYGYQQSLLETIWDNVEAIMFCKDENNNIVKVNNYFCKILNVKREDIEGKNIKDLMKNQIQAGKYAQNDLIVIKSNIPKLGIIETLLDSKITVRTDKFPVQLTSATRGVFGYSVVI